MADPHIYTVGWICAISTELTAAQAFLDEKHDQPKSVAPNDTNVYTLGRIKNHNVVMACLPNGEYGTEAASRVACHMVDSFPNVRFGLLVGVGGGVPTDGRDIRLGDVVVSTPGNGESGIFQYDYGKRRQGRNFLATGFHSPPPTILLNASNKLKSEYEIENPLRKAIEQAIQERKLPTEYQRPDSKTDILYEAKYVHPDEKKSCAVCCNDASKMISRAERIGDREQPKVHYGLIATGNSVMKDALVRDTYGRDKKVLCFEMEAAGLMKNFACLVIRGICDYSDSHKRDEWQPYAAMAAAAYAKDILSLISPTTVAEEKKMSDIIGSSECKLAQPGATSNVF